MCAFPTFRPQQQGNSKRRTIDQISTGISSSSVDNKTNSNINNNNNALNNNPLPPTDTTNPAAFDFLFDGLSAALQSVVPKLSRHDSMLSISLAATATTTTGTTANNNGQGDMYEFEQIPFDWSIMNRIRFTSSHSFFWCSTCSSYAVERGLTENLCHSNNSNNNSNDREEEAAIAFQKASLSWMHPSSILNAKNPILTTMHHANTKPAESMTSDDIACIQYMHQRWLDWEDSFRSVYYRLRNNMCHSFYYESSYIVLFLGPSASHLNDFQVIISNSPASLRALLTKLEIPFTRPLYRESMETAITEEEAREIEEYERIHGKRPSKRMREDDTSDSTASILVISGKNEVHAMYDVLLNFNKRLGDVPVLYSDTPFVGATLKALTITKNNELPRRSGGGGGGSSSSTSSSSSSGLTTEDEQFCLDLQGPILPRQWVQLCHLFSKTQQRFKCYLWPRSFSVNFNVVQLPQLQSLGGNLPPHSLISTKIDLLSRERGVLGLRRVEKNPTMFLVQPSLPSTS